MAYQRRRKIPNEHPKIEVEGWLQGGIQDIGTGQLAFFSEAGMFTAQYYWADKTNSA